MGEHGWDQKQELGERAGAERGLRARSGRQPACFWPGWLSIPLRMSGPGFHHLSRPRWAWLGLKRVLGRGKSRRLQLWNCHYLRAPGQHLLLLPFLLSPHTSTHSSTFSPSCPARGGPRRNPVPHPQVLSPQIPALGLGTSTPPFPTDPKLGARVFFQTWPRTAETLASTRGHSPAPGTSPSGVSYPLPAHLTVLPWMATSSASAFGAQPRLLRPQACPSGPSLGTLDVCHAHGTGQLLFFIMMKNL